MVTQGARGEAIVVVLRFGGIRCDQVEERGRYEAVRGGPGMGKDCGQVKRRFLVLEVVVKVATRRE